MSTYIHFKYMHPSFRSILEIYKGKNLQTLITFQDYLERILVEFSGLELILNGLERIINQTNSQLCF